MLSKFKEFKEDAEWETKTRIECLRSDNGGVYTSREFNDYLKVCKVKTQFTCANNPQQNGVSERQNRTNTEVAGSMMHDKNIPGRFWAESMSTATYVHNRCYFYEAPAWWSENQQQLSDTQVLKEELEGRVTLSFTNFELTEEENNEEEPRTSPRRTSWQTGTNTRNNEVNDQQFEASHEREPSVRRSSRVSKPNPRYANVSILEEQKEVELESFEHASKEGKWMNAMKEEIKALMENQTWELVQSENRTSIVSCKWVFKIKWKTDGTVERYKARLVAREFSQQQGLGYEETFSPVAKLTMVRPKRFESLESPKYPNHVWKLKKALYSLKQSPRAWFGKISKLLELNGFRSTAPDTSLFILAKGKKVALVLVYVDDLIITGDLEEEVEQLKKKYLCKV
ncbi:hypothetical protein L1987_24535 [Smallanthus sonchifolius]|uniref:Uncharacterized protein n=1 Tax=Smallanthus sonchifolius TaxID=185202 RepID=A0ACB9ILA9_9ASTR|nr:hypothetical protein L1987_24535 [Smallanthus sonchifolius]